MRYIAKSSEKPVSIVTILGRHFYNTLFSISPVNIPAQPVDSQTLCPSHCHLEVLDFLLGGSRLPIVWFYSTYGENAKANTVV